MASDVYSDLVIALQDGTVYSVNGLVEPILFTLYYTATGNESQIPECKYWSEDDAEWLAEGVTVHHSHCLQPLEEGGG